MNLKEIVTKKHMYTMMVIAFIIGLCLGQAGTLKDLMNKEEAAFVESLTYADIGDKIIMVCGEGVIDSKCGSVGHVQEGYKSPFMIIWNSGATSHYCNSIEVQNSEDMGKYQSHELDYEKHLELRC